MEKAGMVAPSAPLPEHMMAVQMPTAPPTYDQAMSQQPVPYPVQPPMPMPMPMPSQPAIPPQPPGSYVPMTQVAAGPAQPYPQQQPAAHVVTSTVFVGSVPVGPKPFKMNCPMCHANIKTTAVVENQASAHICCIVLCLLGCWFCSCIPYCMDSFKIVHHSCPNCKAYLGTFKS